MQVCASARLITTSRDCCYLTMQRTARFLAKLAVRYSLPCIQGSACFNVSLAFLAAAFLQTTPLLTSESTALAWRGNPGRR